MKIRPFIFACFGTLEDKDGFLLKDVEFFSVNQLIDCDALRVFNNKRVPSVPLVFTAFVEAAETTRRQGEAIPLESPVTKATFQRVSGARIPLQTIYTDGQVV